jgi:DNA-binding SARP family transcriptional activator
VIALGPKLRMLLGILLVTGDGPLPADRIVELLYDRPGHDAQKALQVHVSRLRKALGESSVRTEASGYRLASDEIDLDMTRFGELAEVGRRELETGDADAASRTLADALALWRGSALADFAYAEFAQPAIALLEERRLSTFEDRVEAELALGRHAVLVGELEALSREHPVRERLTALLMLALYRSGRQAEALEAYQRARASLVDELGIDPSRTLRDLHQAILRQDPSLEHTQLTSTIGTDGVASTFVGRESELEALHSGLESARAGEGRVFLVSGEPGIGKSRLAEEVINAARARGMRVLVGRAWEAGGAPAYWPWVQSLRTLVDDVADDDLRTLPGIAATELSGLLPELGERFGGLPEPADHDPEAARFRLFEAVASLVSKMAERQPIVLMLDDLHAADEPSLLMLRFVARELARARVLVLAAYRDVDPTPTHPLTVAVTELLREPLTQQLHLAGLARSDIARFIELLSGEVPTRELVDIIHGETEGNPLFAGEIVRLLTAEGRLDAADAEHLAIPQTVRDVISRRLEHLSEVCKRALVLASILGREFRIDALSLLAELPEDELVEVLDEALGARVLAESPGAIGQLRFAHVLIRDTLYDELTTVRRIGLHRRTMRALEDLYLRDPGPHLAELALHAAAGGEFEQAVAYAQRAGDRALALLAYEEAARLYRTALDALELDPPVKPEARCELLLALGEAQSQGGDSAEARETCLAAAAVARDSGLPQHLARAALVYGGRFPWLRAGTDRRLVPLLEEALSALGDEQSELKVRLLARLAGALRDQPSLEPRSSLAREAVAIARRLDDADTLGYALVSLTTATWGPDVEELIPYVDEIHELAEQTGDLDRTFQWGWLQHIVWITIGDTARVAAVAERHRLVADELKQRSQQWYSTVMRSVVALFRGDYAEAEQLAEEARELGERAQRWDAGFSYLAIMFALRRDQGRLAEVEDPIREAIDEYAGYRSFRSLLPLVQCELGRVDEARARFDELAAGNFLDLPRDAEWLFNLSVLADIAVYLGDRQRAEMLYEQLLPYARMNAPFTGEVALGSVSRYLGKLACLLARRGDAARHFEVALESNAHSEARPWLARTREDYGRMLLESDDPDARERGRELIALALSAYEELGMLGPLERARVLEP